MFLISAFLSIFCFNWATNLRSAEQQEPLLKRAEIASDMSQSSLNRIMFRLSYLQNGMLPIAAKDTNQTKKLAIFSEKYGFTNQSQILINNLVPGDIFKFDVYPNQYFRAAFLDYTLEICQSYYTSMVITLPVFIYMNSNFLMAILISGFLIWLYFILVYLITRINPAYGVTLIPVFYSNFLSYFDNVMLVKTIILSLLSTFMFITASKAYDYAKNENVVVPIRLKLATVKLSTIKNRFYNYFTSLR